MHAITVSTCKSDLKSRILEVLIWYGYYLEVYKGNVTTKRCTTKLYVF